jgi:hypothetical protein
MTNPYKKLCFVTTRFLESASKKERNGKNMVRSDAVTILP